MNQVLKDNPAVSQAELLGAALRYCAVADWFESHPCTWDRRMSLSEAMDVFNRVEAELRSAGARALRRGGHRELILQAVGIEEDAR
ncbi:MAG TPA: hypothetical protein PLP01_05180 [Phycisphaerae bacterium]|jgi:hypothetical protein|nr:hypothetical protein [Phycisphaerae bacterium]NLX58915.1 hypothetical protein [Phycisphaerae bacterium]HOA76025.1 hypothetical protein [Phycisphaerae bacterium]HOI54618.1 hypothetical protein [Phycisphaerae bacterium]